ncbi:Replicase polyprotein 1a [Bienertia sinuspersici]
MVVAGFGAQFGGKDCGWVRLGSWVGSKGRGWVRRVVGRVVGGVVVLLGLEVLGGLGAGVVVLVGFEFLGWDWAGLGMGAGLMVLVGFELNGVGWLRQVRVAMVLGRIFGWDWVGLGRGLDCGGGGWVGVRGVWVGVGAGLGLGSGWVGTNYDGYTLSSFSPLLFLPASGQCLTLILLWEMVGFFRESSKQEEEGGTNEQKVKTSNYPDNLNFDFEGYSSEFGGFSLTSAEPFLDFDSIKDWIEEMQVPDSVESNKAVMGNEGCVESLLGNQITDSLVDLGQDMNGSEKSARAKVECRVSDDNMDNRGGIVGDNSLVELDVMKDNDMKKAESGSSEIGEINSDIHHGNESGVGILGDKNCHEVEIIGCSIEEGLEKFTLVGDEVGTAVAGSDMTKVATPVVTEDSDSDSESKSVCGTSSSSSSLTSSSSSESDDDDEEVKQKEVLIEIKKETAKQTLDVEEGQILDSDGDNIVSRSDNEDEGEDDDTISNKYSEEFQFVDDDEDGDVVKGPIKSKNELKVN